MDEARHVEAYARLLHEKFELAYPITPHAQRCCSRAPSRDRRWDMTYLGMQVLIEGLALAAFQRIRDTSKNPLAAAVNAYVMQDEARHVAFGRLALRDYYPQLTRRRARRARGVRGRGLLPHARPLQPAARCGRTSACPSRSASRRSSSPSTCGCSARACSRRIVPTVKDIGLWGPRVRKAYEDMGVMEFADVDAEAMLDNDNRVAEEFDAKRFVAQALATE